MEDRPLGPFAVVVAHGVLIVFVFVLAWLLDDFRSRFFLWALVVGVPLFAVSALAYIVLRSITRRRRHRAFRVAVASGLLGLFVTLPLLVALSIASRGETPRGYRRYRRVRRDVWTPRAAIPLLPAGLEPEANVQGEPKSPYKSILPTESRPDNPAPTEAEDLLPALDRQEQPSFFSDEPSDRDPLKDFLQKYPRRSATSTDTN